MKKKVSIIIPVYNVEKELERCIKSVLNQTYSYIEIILVNDGSTDTSYQICEKYLKKDARIKYFKKENGGLSDARNYGQERCTGDYILFLDSDDYIESEAIKRLLTEAVEGNLDIVCANAIKEEGLRKSKLINPKKPNYNIMSGQDYLISSLKNKQYTPTVWTNLYSSQFLRQHDISFIRGLLHEDTNWTPKIFLAAKSVKYIDYCFYHYIIREGSITQKKNLSQNIIDAIWTCKDLETYYLQFQPSINSRNLKVLRNSLANKYIYIMTLDKTSTKENFKQIDQDFIKRNSKTILTKIKVQLFLFNPNYYYKIKKVIRRLVG